jgi:hypothetical protein
MVSPLGALGDESSLGLKEDQAMQFQDLINREVAHGLTTAADRVRHSS